ncbi:MAG: hypothetical protein KY468_07755 [Armatimonadetes bacterium]|nr:hypothetical protein [Armatimonadota bacterium]
MQPDSDPRAGQNKWYWIGILVVLAMMVLLAAWAWWIPGGAFAPWIK